MKLNYNGLAEKYKPNKIKILLIGEAPPPSGRKYFYKVPEIIKPSKTIEDDTSLPSTIFNHYFGRIPKNSVEYEEFLNCLKKNGVFLIDLYKKPEKFRGNKKNQKKLFTSDNIKQIVLEVKSLNSEESFQIVFLLARNYLKGQLDILRKEFPEADLTRWKKFRMNVSDNIECK